MAIREVRRADAVSAAQHPKTLERADVSRARVSRLELLEGGLDPSLNGDGGRVTPHRIPELCPSAHRNERSNGRRLVDQALLCVLDMMPMGVLLVDTKCRIVRMNARAGAFISATGVLNIGADGRCYARQGQQDSRFQHALSTALAIGAPTGDARFVALGAAEGQAPVVAQVCTVGAGSESWAAIFLFGEHAQLSASAQALRSVFGLTSAESELAVALAYGSTLSEYARTRGITINTAKTQLRGALSKTATRRQSALIRLILLQLPCVSAAGAHLPLLAESRGNLSHLI